MKRSWINIDLEQLKCNYQTYKDIYGSDLPVMAVVKANAYGHGDIIVARTLAGQGVEYFAVSNVYEGIRLRENGIGGDILVLGYTPIHEMPLLKVYDISQAVLSEEYAELIAGADHSGIAFHFAINTGMNRIGINCDDPDECERIIRRYGEELNLQGIFTHLCVADGSSESDIEFTRKQIEKFDMIAKRTEDMNLPFVHCLNSAGGMRYTSIYNNLIRLGIVMYGLKPDISNTLPEKIAPVLSWKTVVSMVRTLHEGDTVGYGRTFRAERDMRIAVVPTGYADGYNRRLSNRGYVLINGCRAPITGNICMDQMMVDVTGIDDVGIGDEVVLIGKSGDLSVTADELGQMAGTIGYEIVCNIAERVERIVTE